ncbi:thioredoxin-like protein [Phyllosticta capitalensis]
MVELRKRKTPPPAPEKPSKKKTGPKAAAKGAKAKPAVAAATEAVDNTPAAPKVEQPVKDTNTSSTATNGAKSSGKPEVGKTIDLDGFGGEIETNDGTKTSLKKLVDDSKAGVVLFTYPKASTPGCTKQACLFRDSYTPLTATGLSIYGLSADSPKSNTTFKTKQNLPYPLLCDPSFALIKAIGLAKPGNAKGTVRGVFVVDKAGKVLAAEPGGPDATVEVVRKLVGTAGGGGDAAPAADAAEDKKDGEDKKADKSEGNGEEVKADGDAK